MTRLLLALLLAAGPAAAVEPVECVRAEEGEGTADSPDGGENLLILSISGPVTDLGGGLVATETLEHWTQHLHEGLFVDHCASGQGFHILTEARDGLGDRRLAPDPYALLRDLVVSPEAMTLEEVRGHFGSFAGPVAARRVETCGCAAFYPELRGDRDPFRSSAVAY